MTFTHVVTWFSGKIVPFKTALTRLKHSLLKRLSGLTSLQILSANVLPKPKPKVTWPLKKPWSFLINAWCEFWPSLVFLVPKKPELHSPRPDVFHVLICIFAGVSGGLFPDTASFACSCTYLVLVWPCSMSLAFLHLRHLHCLIFDTCQAPAQALWFCFCTHTPLPVRFGRVLFFDLAVRIVLPYPALWSGALASPHFFSAWQLPFDAARRAQQQHHNYKPTTLQLQLQLRYTTLHPAVVGEVTDQVTTATIVATPKKHNSNHLSVHQWIRSAIRDSQQPNSPIGFLLWNFRRRLVRHYWYYRKDVEDDEDNEGV